MESSSSETTTSFTTQPSVGNKEPHATVPTNGSESGDNLVEETHKVLHFCDGALEECPPEEDELDQKSNIEVDPKSLSWGPWMLYLTTSAGKKTLQAIDYVGESLANFFGITTPKYQYEIDEYEIMRAEEEEEKKHHDLEMGGWTETATADESNLTENISLTKDKVTEEICVKSQPQSLQS